VSRTHEANKASQLSGLSSLIQGQDLTWQAEAACRTVDHRVFFDPAKVRQAKAHCAACPVVGPCLEYGLLNRINGSYSGVWGGMDEKELGVEYRLRRRQRAKAKLNMEMRRAAG
jgi:hypothetical protein